MLWIKNKADMERYVSPNLDGVVFPLKDPGLT